MKTNVLVTILIFIALVIGLFWFFSVANDDDVDNVNDNNIVVTSTPTPTTTATPEPTENQPTPTPTEQPDEQQENINIINPEPNAIVTSPLDVTGEARGTWYFEADFPVYLYDGNGNQIAQGIAQADGDWMTESFVPFTATLEFEAPQTETGELVLERANPSGLEENAESISIPVSFE